jgi:hypothetical protein
MKQLNGLLIKNSSEKMRTPGRRLALKQPHLQHQRRSQAPIILSHTGTLQIGSVTNLGETGKTIVTK